MVHRIIGKTPPNKRLLQNGESRIIKLSPGQMSPNDPGGTYLYTRIGENLFRVPYEPVEWGE